MIVTKSTEEVLEDGRKIIEAGYKSLYYRDAKRALKMMRRARRKQVQEE